MEALLAEIKACQLCKGKLPHTSNPVMTAHTNNKLLIIGQAPGTKVHQNLLNFIFLN
jgi:uracil-DNA glycosylase